MAVYASTQLAVPMFQVILLLILSTLALLMGRLRLALFINYCFTIYWGYVANLDLFAAAELSKLNSFTFIYFGLGIVIVLLAMAGLYLHHE
jgi:hypothetical protein